MAKQVEAPDRVSSVERDTPHRALRRRLASRLVDMQRHGECAMMPDARMDNVSFFTDPDHFACEQEAFFRGMPVVACPSCELPEPGSFKAVDYAGGPVLLSLGKDGKVRAFLNVCPHRGSRIQREPCGKASHFICRLHGWTCDWTGKVIGIPAEDLFCGQTDARESLYECPAEERHGFVFVKLASGTTLDLDAHPGELDRDLAAIGLETAEIVHTDTLQVAGNWKYGPDRFFETYHLNSLHRETFKGLFSPVNVFDTFGRHHRYTFAPLTLADWVDKDESE